MGYFDISRDRDTRSRDDSERRRLSRDNDDPEHETITLTTLNFGEVEAEVGSAQEVCTSMIKSSPRPFEVTLPD